jgi:hypothetical protein
MKNLIFFFLLFILITPRTFARTFGLGVQLGNPTGITGKYNYRDHTSINGVLAYDSHEIVIYGDYLHHFPEAFRQQKNAFLTSLLPYVGVGPLFAFGDGEKEHNHNVIDEDEDEFAFGVRIPLGVEWLSKEIPIGISLEIAPGITIIPGTDAFIQGGLAIRYYFE